MKSLPDNPGAEVVFSDDINRFYCILPKIANKSVIFFNPKRYVAVLLSSC